MEKKKKKNQHLESTWKIMWEKDWLEKEGHLEKVNNEFFVEGDEER